MQIGYVRVTQGDENGLLVRRQVRTDSTHVLAAVHVLNRLQRVSETLRAALNELAAVAPKWLQALAPAAWYNRYGRRVEKLVSWPAPRLMPA